LNSSKYASYVAGQPNQLNAAALDKFAQDEATPGQQYTMKTQQSEELIGFTRLLRNLLIAPSFFIDP
jgi:hypothetical protein